MQSLPRYGQPECEWEHASKWRSAIQALILMAVLFLSLIYSARDGSASAPPPSVRVSLMPQLPTLPPSQDPVEEPAPPPETKVTPPPPPEPPAPVLKKPAPTPAADIALKKPEKTPDDQARKEAEQKKEQELEEKKRREQEQKLKEQEEKKKEQEKKEREEMLAQLEQERLEEEKRQEVLERMERSRQEVDLRAQAEARRGQLKDVRLGYIRRIKDAIHPDDPPGLENADIETVLEVRLLPNGRVESHQDVIVLQSSGFPQYDEAARRGVLKAVPLPVPKEPELQEEFRVLTLRISPRR